MTSVNQEFVSTLNETKKSVLAEIKCGRNHVFKIGEKLALAKAAIVYNISEASEIKGREREYAKLFDELHFTKAVGEKFIRIYNCEYLRELHKDAKTTNNLTYAYNTLYELATERVASNEKHKNTIIEVFTNGEVTIDGKIKSSRQLTLKDIRELTKDEDTKSSEDESNASDENIKLDEDFTFVREKVDNSNLSDFFSNKAYDKFKSRFNDDDESKIEDFLNEVEAVFVKYEIVSQELAVAAE